jgi:hypothetical protein
LCLLRLSALLVVGVRQISMRPSRPRSRRAASRKKFCHGAAVAGAFDRGDLGERRRRDRVALAARNWPRFREMTTEGTWPAAVSRGGGCGSSQTTLGRISGTMRDERGTLVRRPAGKSQYSVSRVRRASRAAPSSSTARA